MAALVVLVFHVALLSPAFDDLEPGARPHEPSWWITHTPLNLFWAGSEAVFVFFVLSGFVLALPATVRAVHWRSYYPQRLLRLYLPVWGSLVLAVGWTLLVPRRELPQLSDWYGSHVPVQGLVETARNGLLLLDTGYINSPLWSLRWELLFSLLLPLYLLVARRLRRWWVLELVGLVVVVGAAGALDVERALYLPMFAVGVVLAFERERVSALAHRWTAGGPLPRWALAGLGVLLLTSDASLMAFGLGSQVALGGAMALQVAGAGLIVVLALHWEPLRSALLTGWVQWVGVRSFSLYLVHEPIVVSSASLWPDLPAGVHLLVVLPVALLVAHLFHLAVERPAHRLSRWVGARLRPVPAP